MPRMAQPKVYVEHHLLFHWIVKGRFSEKCREGRPVANCGSSTPSSGRSG